MNLELTETRFGYGPNIVLLFHFDRKIDANVVSCKITGAISSRDLYIGCTGQNIHGPCYIDYRTSTDCNVRGVQVISKY